MIHVAGQIISEIASRLSSLAMVHVVPLHTVDIESLPAIFIEEIEDETAQSLGDGPIDETHRLSFTVFGAQAAVAGFVASASTFRSDIELALLNNPNDIRLGGLCWPGLSRPSAVFRVDAESLQKPVGGWSLRFTCTYHLNTGKPDTHI